MKAFASRKSLVALLLCCALLALSSCNQPAGGVSSSPASGVTGTDSNGTTDGNTADNTDTTASEQAGTESTTASSASPTASAKGNSSKKSGQTTGKTSSVKSSSSKNTTSKATSSQATIIKPEIEVETVTKPEEIPEAKPIEKPEEIKPVITGLTPIKTENFHGRSLLAKRANAATLLAAYDRIVAGIENAEAEISLNDPEHPIKESDFREVLDYYLADYPHHFWLDKEFGFSKGEQSIIYKFMPKYLIDKSELAQAKTAWDAAAKEILKDISGSASDYEREKLIHDQLAARVTYEFTENAYNAYGALVEGKAVCEGYAEAFQYLCYQAGIPCLIVTGSSINPSSGQPENHAWNMAQIDGAYYHVDVTWDDQDISLFYAYFNLNNQQIKEDHTISNDNYFLPACNATVANYFVKNTGNLGSSYTAEQVGALLKAGNGTAHIYVDDTKTFWEWFQEDDTIQKIAKILGIKGGFSLGCTYLGHEVIPWVR